LWTIAGEGGVVLFNLAWKLKRFIFADDNDFDTQETIDNETKVFNKQDISNDDSGIDDSTIIREPIGRKQVSLVIRGSKIEQRKFILDSVETNIGRQQGNEVVLKDKGVSRVHAQLINEKYYYKIRDLSSTNGLYVNGEAIEEQKLTDGDEIRLGETILEFSLDG
jgi:pSer/pThr/pTyr-binding forkhead associated (FHA) protein